MTVPSYLCCDSAVVCFAVCGAVCVTANPYKDASIDCVVTLLSYMI